MNNESRLNFTSFRNPGFSLKLYTIVFLAFVGIVGITSLALVNGRNDLEKNKRAELRHLVETAVSTIAAIEARSSAGEMSKTEAQQLAMRAISDFRYQGNHYFWINDTRVHMVMHPIKPKLDGKDLSGLEDPNGKRLFVEFVNVVKKSGSGFVGYMWPKPGKQEPQPKLSYVQGFAPWGWVIGTGAYVDDLDATFWENTKSLGGVVLVILLVIIAVSLTLARSISLPMKQIIQVMGDLAKGNIKTEIPHLKRHDEIGQMAKAMLVFRGNANKRQELEEQQVVQKAESEKQQRQALLQLADDFDSQVKSIVVEIGNSSETLEQTSDSMAERIAETTTRIGAIASSMETTSGNVDTVASASEEMSSSISEISSRMQESAQFSQTAVQEVTHANQVIGSLSEASNAIGQIVGLINDIAEQTNLLALNATIEAARAGESGKGFAVVASEVKSLASQTAKATEEISTQINTIQSSISEAVVVIDDVGETISKLDEVTGSIATAVEEQGLASGEISSSINQAAMGSRDVFDNTEVLRTLAAENGQSTQSMTDSVHALHAQINELQNQADAFINGIRSQNGASKVA